MKNKILFFGSTKFTVIRLVKAFALVILPVLLQANGLSSQNRYFLKDKGQNSKYVFYYQNKIQYGHLEPEAFQFVKVSGTRNTYHIRYMAKDMYWKNAKGHGKWLNLNGSLLTLGGRHTQWELSDQGNNHYTATPKGSNRTFRWIVELCQDLKTLFPREKNIFGQLEEGMKIVSFEKILEGVELAPLGLGRDIQNPLLGLNIEAEMSQLNDNKKVVSVYVKDSFIKPSGGPNNGNLLVNSSRKKAWFLDYAEVLISVRDLENPGERLHVAAQGPEPTSNSGSTSMSRSTHYSNTLGGSIGVSIEKAKIGVNGEINYSHTWGGGRSNSVSINFDEYRLRHTGDHKNIKHEYQLGLTENGRYHKPRDLINGSRLLSRLPDKASGGNFPLWSNGVFIGDSNTGKVRVDVIIRFTLQSIELLQPRRSMKNQYGYANYEVRRVFDINLGDL